MHTSEAVLLDHYGCGGKQTREAVYKMIDIRTGSQYHQHHHQLPASSGSTHHHQRHQPPEITCMLGTVALGGGGSGKTSTLHIGGGAPYSLQQHGGGGGSGRPGSAGGVSDDGDSGHGDGGGGGGGLSYCVDCSRQEPSVEDELCGGVGGGGVVGGGGLVMLHDGEVCFSEELLRHKLRLQQQSAPTSSTGGGAGGDVGIERCNQQTSETSSSPTTGHRGAGGCASTGVGPRLTGGGGGCQEGFYERRGNPGETMAGGRPLSDGGKHPATTQFLSFKGLGLTGGGGGRCTGTGSPAAVTGNSTAYSVYEVGLRTQLAAAAAAYAARKDVQDSAL